MRCGKFRVAMGLVPLISAMFANSSISEGRLNGFMTLRGHIWTDTDSARSGMLPFAFSPDAGIEDYVNYALDVPMYFIIRRRQTTSRPIARSANSLRKAGEQSGQRSRIGRFI